MRIELTIKKVDVHVHLHDDGELQEALRQIAALEGKVVKDTTDMQAAVDAAKIT